MVLGVEHLEAAEVEDEAPEGNEADVGEDFIPRARAPVVAPGVLAACEREKGC